MCHGSVSIVNSEANPPLISGSVISNVLSLVLLVSISLAFPEGKFDWNIYKERITSADEEVRISVFIWQLHASLSCSVSRAEVHPAWSAPLLL